MEDYKNILKRVGVVLISIGLLDIGAMIYCIANQISYSSSFNIFAVIAGISLYRGGLTSARVVAWFAAYMFITFTMLLVVFPLIEPLGLLKAKFSLDPAGLLISVAFVVAVLSLLAWVYKQLRSPAVVDARKEAGLVTTKPKVAYALGAILPVTLGAVMYLANNGESGQLVKATAAEVYGGEYEYHINSMHWSDSEVSAQLAAFNEREIIPLFVACKRGQLTSGTSGCSLRSPR
jgi:hypothetical protein